MQQEAARDDQWAEQEAALDDQWKPATSQTVELSADNPVKAEETLLGRGNIDSRGGPCVMPRTVPSGLIFLPPMFRGDQLFCQGRSGGTGFGEDQFLCDRPFSPLKTFSLFVMHIMTNARS